MKRKVLDQERILAEHLHRLKRNDFCHCNKACLSERKDWVQRAKQGGRPAEISFWKRAGCQTESKALEKSIVERIVREPGLGLLNSTKMD